MSHFYPRRLTVKIVLGGMAGILFLLGVGPSPARLVAKGNSRGMTVSQAIGQSQKTGRPIFAVAGASYCPACVKLMKTLNTEASLRPFRDQFVPLKISTESVDYRRWKQFFPPERAAIPALYIVSSEGKQLYGRVGSLPAQSLQKVMLASLEKVGRYPSREAWEKIGTTLKSVEQALTEKRPFEAISLLEPMLSRVAAVGALAELSSSGKQASGLIEDFAAEQYTDLSKDLQVFLERGDLETALQVATTEQICQLFPSLRTQVAVKIKKNVKQPNLRKLLRQAREWNRAEQLTQAGDAKSQRKVISAWQRITKRYPQTEVASHAEQKLRELKSLESPMNSRN